MEEVGIVRKRANESATVVFKKGETDACGGCTVCRALGKGEFELTAENPLGADEGDMVRVKVDRFAATSYIPLYLIPIAMMFIGYFLFPFLFGTPQAHKETLGIVGAFTFLIVYFIALFFILKGRKKKRSAEIIAIVAKRPSVSS